MSEPTDWKERYRLCQNSCNKHVGKLRQLEGQLARSEQALREMSLDLDRWKYRAVVSARAIELLHAEREALTLLKDKA